MSYVKIELTRGLFTIIDKEDADRVNTRKWNAHKTHNKDTYYATCSINGKHCQMANFILNHDPKGCRGQFIVDHINGDGLDNRKCNLRIISRSQNAINRKIPSNNTSRIIGVSHNKQHYAYIVSWNEGNERQTKSFSYGKENKDSKKEKRKAKKKAKRYRQKMENTVPNYVKALEHRKNNSIDSCTTLENIEVLNRVNKIRRTRMKKPFIYNVYFSDRSSQNRSSAFISLWIENGKRKHKSFTIGRVANPTYEKAKENATKHNNEMKDLQSINIYDKFV